MITYIPVLIPPKQALQIYMILIFCIILYNIKYNRLIGISYIHFNTLFKVINILTSERLRNIIIKIY